MILSDLAVRRPVLASVLSLVIVTLGIVSMLRLSMRELPDIDAPRVSIGTNYPGAAAAVIESRVTQVIENAISDPAIAKAQNQMLESFGGRCF